MKIYIPTNYNSGNQHIYPSYNFLYGLNGETIFDKVFATRELAQEFLDKQDVSNTILEFDLIENKEDLNKLFKKENNENN